MVPVLRVDRLELLRALKNLAKLASPKQQAEAIVSLDGSAVVIELAGMTVRAGAEGTWPGQARVNARFLLGLARGLPPGDILSLTVEEGKLQIAGSSTAYSAPCVWQAAGGNVIRLPVNPTLSTILALRLRHTDDEIAGSGLTETVRLAEKRCDTLVAQASTILEPLGVRPADLRQLVDECLLREEHP